MNFVIELYMVGGRDGRKSENRSASSMIGVCTKTPENFLKNTWLSLSPGHCIPKDFSSQPIRSLLPGDPDYRVGLVLI